MEPQPPTPTPPKKRHRLRRWLIGIAAGFVILLLVLWLSFPAIGRAIIRHELQSVVAGNLNAELQIDDLSYSPLLKVAIGHARLVMPGPNGGQITIAELSGLKVSLGRLPTGGPIVVDDFTLVDPTFTLVRLPSGDVQIEQNLLRASSASAAPSNGGFAKPSSMIEIKHFQISNFTVQARDWQSDRPPIVLAHLNLQLDLASEAGNYTFTVTATNKPLADVNIAGSLDIDGTTIRFKNFSAHAELPRQLDTADLPPPVAALWRQYDLGGTSTDFSVDDGATFTVDLAGGRWKASNFRGGLTVAGNGDTRASGRLLFNIAAGGPLPTADAPLGLSYLPRLDPDTLVSVYVDPNDRLDFASPSIPQPITDGTGAMEFSGGVLALKAVDVHYGAGDIHLQTTARLLPDRLSLSGFRLDVAGGAVLVDSADLELKAPNRYSARLVYEQIDLHQVMQIAQASDPDLANSAAAQKISGQASGSLNADGSLPPGIPPLAAVAGDGSLHVEDGDFFDIPVLNGVAGKVIPDLQQEGRVGQAAAVFSFAGGTLKLSKIAVSAPIVGIQGGGTVGMLGDNPVDLSLTVAPFGDWRKQANDAGVPVLGQLIGGLQQAVNKVQKALYSFHVTGPAAHPSIKAVPVPAISKDAQNAFGQMVKGAQNGANGLLDLLQTKKN